MPSFDILCLANSLKRGGRCIAGLKIDGSEWLRPISNRENGTLFQEHYFLKNNDEPQLFDILRIDCTQASPKPHQPENWLISDKKWDLIGSPSFDELKKLLTSEHEKSATCTYGLLGDDCNSLSWDYLQQNPAQKSLCLIYVKEIKWKIYTSHEKRKYKAIFTFNNNDYELPVTDPNWQEEMQNLSEGQYTSEQLIEQKNLDKQYDPERFLLTISLSEPFQPPHLEHQLCYKLVASVLNTKMIRNLYGNPL